MTYCKTEGCLQRAVEGASNCHRHRPILDADPSHDTLAKGMAVQVSTQGIVAGFGVNLGVNAPTTIVNKTEKPTLAELYPKYYKAVPKGWEFMDTYAVNILFPVDDPSGCILHARKKLLVPGVRSGGKSMRKDITEARDTLNRWLELNQE